MTEYLPPVLGALIGVLVGGTVTGFINRENFRLQTTVALLNEWHSPAMRAYRAIAEKETQTTGFIAAWEKSADLLKSDPTQLDAETKKQDALSNVIHYFEKVEVLRCSHSLREEVAKEAMGSIIRWWVPRLLLGVDAKNEGEWRPLVSRLRNLDRKLGRTH